MEMTCCCTRVLDQGHPAAGIHYSKLLFLSQDSRNGEEWQRKTFSNLSPHKAAICVTFIEASPDSLLKAKI